MINQYPSIEFVDWCSCVLKKLIELEQENGAVRLMGANEKQIAEAIFGDEVAGTAEFRSSSKQKAISGAASALGSVAVLENVLSGSYPVSMWKVSQLGRHFSEDPVIVWEPICRKYVTKVQEEFLRLVNRLSKQAEPDHAWLTSLFYQDESYPEITELGDANTVKAIAIELKELGLLDLQLELGANFRVCSNFSGQVWETKRDYTLEARRIDGLVTEWETTSVEFKRELSLSSNDHKVEFVKDLIALADTLVSGRRLMIIGFDNDRIYHGPPSPQINQNRIEQIIAEYVEPMVDLRYREIEYRLGRIGELEVLFHPEKLPHSVRRGLKGLTKQIREGQIFVRHGTQVEEPTQLEEEAIRQEGIRARSLGRP